MKCGALSVLGLAGERVMGAVSFPNQPMLAVASDRSVDRDLSVIGVYGSWAASLHGDGVPSLSFRNERFADVEAWRVSARKCVTNRMAIPGIGSTPKISFKKEYLHEGLHIEEISWQGGELSRPGAVRKIQRESAATGAHHQTREFDRAFLAGGSGTSHGAQSARVAQQVSPPGDAARTKDRQSCHGS